MASKYYLSMTVFCLSIYYCNTAKILCLFPMPAKSHVISSSVLVKELVNRGHHVTVVSPFPEKSNVPNYVDIEFKASIPELLNNSVSGTSDLFNTDKLNYFQILKMYWDLGIKLCDKFLQEESIQKLVTSKEEYDVLITGAFFNDCVFGIAHILKIPVIQHCSFGGTKWMDEWVGNPSPYAIVPNVFHGCSDKMSFWQRILNALGEMYIKLGREFYTLPQHDALVRKHLKNTGDMPYISNLNNYTTLLLLNSHFSISYPRPLMPNTVEVGGLHIAPPRRLSSDLQTYIDEATDGVVYFSMGSNLRSTNMKNSTIKAFLVAFSKLKQRVLWKWDADKMSGQPSNVKLGKWLPQSDILAHPNVRLFVTHGGLLSTQEAIARGVPLLCIPIFGDQRYNVAKVVSADIGVPLDYSNITTESLSWALSEVLDNPRYRENIQRLSKIYKDQPQTPLERAVFWTEYVIRHKGAPHMRSAVLDLAWYQYFLLDIIFAFIVVSTSILVVLFLVIRFGLRIVFHKEEPKGRNKKIKKK